MLSQVCGSEVWVFISLQFGALAVVGCFSSGSIRACGAMGELVYNIVPVDDLAAAKDHPAVLFPEVLTLFGASFPMLLVWWGVL